MIARSPALRAHQAHPASKQKNGLGASLTVDAKPLYAKRKQTVEPVFGIIKSAMGFVRFRLRGLRNAATEWTLTALAYNCRRIARLQTP